MNVANAILVHAISYHFSVSHVPSTLLKKITARVRAMIRKQRVAKSYPPELLHMDKNEGGWGLKDLEVEQKAIAITTWVEMLNKTEFVSEYIHKIMWEYLRYSQEWSRRAEGIGERWSPAELNKQTMLGRLGNMMGRMNWELWSSVQHKDDIGVWLVGRTVRVKNVLYKIVHMQNKGEEIWWWGVKKVLTEESPRDPRDEWTHWELIGIDRKKIPRKQIDFGKVRTFRTEEEWAFGKLGREQKNGTQQRAVKIWKGEGHPIKFSRERWEWLRNKWEDWRTTEASKKAGMTVKEYQEIKWKTVKKREALSRTEIRKRNAYQAEKAKIQTWKEDMTKLIHEYQVQDDIEVVMRDHWANSEGIYEIFKKYFKAKREYFASPFNVTGVFTEYCSRFDIDKKFGALRSSWEVPWDKNGVVNPMYTDEEMTRTVGRALEHSQRYKSTLILNMPIWESNT